jgi:hypothetical protein
MGHVDDGTLNALLDGELDAAAGEEIRSHVAGCPECARRLEEARRFLAEADDLLGVLAVPPPAVAPAASPRRVSKTAKEVAIDLDGATHKSPAIVPEPSPDLSRGGPGGRARRPPFDFTTLAWAATLVLALGVGFLANEVRHGREPLARSEGGAGVPAPAAPESASVTAAAPAPGRPADAAKAGVPRGRAASTQVAARSSGRSRGRPHQVPRPTRKPQMPNAGKQLAIGERPGAQAPVAAEGAAVLAGVAGRRDTAAAGRAAPAGALGGAAADRAARAPVPALARGAVEPRAAANAAEEAAPPAAFRPATLAEAVARLDGAIRLIDGMQVDAVEVGPGRLVPGADRAHDVVRVVYRHTAGGRLQLDEQRVGVPADTAAIAREGVVFENVGMAFGDTLVTASVGGQVRVRWISRDGFWLSLTGPLPADSLRTLVGRIR